jgi:hypothetical protein
MTRWLERFAIAAVAAAAAFAVATATATGHGGSARVGFIDIPHGGTARFAGTTATCINPKAGGGLTCDVSYVRWRNTLRFVPTKYSVSLRLNGIEVSKSARSARILWTRSLR